MKQPVEGRNVSVLYSFVLSKILKKNAQSTGRLSRIMICGCVLTVAAIIASCLSNRKEQPKYLQSAEKKSSLLFG